MPVLRGPSLLVPIPRENIYSVIFKNLDNVTSNVALVEETTGAELTFGQYADQTHRVACGMHDLGVHKGSVVAIYSPNRVEYAIVFLAAQRLGAVITPANPGYTAREVNYQVVNSGAEWVFTPAESVPLVEKALQGSGIEQKIVVIGPRVGGYKMFADLLASPARELPPVQVEPDLDTAVIPYSSGTTGLPKGVEITHTNLATTLNFLEQEQFDDSPILGYLPMYHMYGLALLLYAAHTGRKFVVMPKFLPELFCSSIEKYKVSTLFTVPPVCMFLIKSPIPRKYDLSSLKFIVSGAAPMGEDTGRTIKRMYGAVTAQAWGMTETSAVGTIPLHTAKAGSVGKVYAGMEIKIVNPDGGETLDTGQQGELWIRGPQVMKGYLGNPSATRQTLTADGWLKTGDCGYYDTEGNIYVTDRLKELIKYKGFQVAPAELEHLLNSHPAIDDSAVIGVPDQDAGELSKAFVVRRKGVPLTADQVLQFVQDNTAKHKWLRGGVQFVESIPKSASGKILRKELKRRMMTAKL